MDPPSAYKPDCSAVAIVLPLLTETTNGNLYLPPATETLSYDLDGNLQSDGRWSYTWDAENRLIAMQTHPSAITVGIPIKRVEYQYDADSRRIARAEPVWDSTNATFQPDPSPTHYIWKNWILLAEFTLQASVPKITQTYLWGLDLAESLDQTGNVGNLLAILDPTGPTPITLLPTYDSNGNIISLTDAATATKAITYEYDAFGQQVIKTNHAALENKPAALIEATANNQWSFSTKPEDPTTGLHYYGYRFYDSKNGRWINRDPIGERGGVNLYGFIGNDPTGKLDILGLDEESSTKKIVFIAGPNFSAPNGTARGALAKLFGVPEGTVLYNGSHPFGPNQKQLDDFIKTFLTNWEQSNRKKCCFAFQGAKFESSKSDPMTVGRARSLIDKWSKKADLLILQAHGIRDALSNNETGLVFYIGKDPANGFEWGITYSVSSVVTAELTSLPLLACNDKGIPDKVGGTKIIKVGGNQFGQNLGGEATNFIRDYIKQQCDACKKN